MIKILNRHKSKLILSLLALVLLFGFSNSNRYFEIAKNLDIFATLYKETNAFYVDEINPSKLINVGVEEMLASLDPYTVYISEDRIEDFKTLNAGQYGGVGAETVRIGEELFISMVNEGSVADQEGVEVGDKIISVDGQPVAGLDDAEILQLVKGEIKTTMTVTAERLGASQPLTFTLKREKITIPNVPYYSIVEGNTGYIKFTEFSNEGSLNIRKAMQALEKQGAEKLILDLRNNPGGFLMEAVNISNLYIPRGMEVVRTKGKVKENNNVFSTLSQPLNEDVPLVVLISSGSASASEIVAGTLQDYDRAVIIGQKSFGKGLVQSTRPLSYNAQLKLTIAKYYIPSGRCVQALDYSHRNLDGSVGRIPDSLKVAFKTRNGRVVYDGGGIDPDVLTPKKELPQVAINLIQSGMIFKYANIYKAEHESIPEAKDFELTEAEFEAFVDWTSTQDLQFRHDIDVYLDEIKADAELDQKTALVSPILEQIARKIDIPVADYVWKYKAQISNILEAEIAARYYLQKGSIEAGLGDDQTFAKALEVLNDKESYKRLLQ